jgi:pilus assembly protein CpaE
MGQQTLLWVGARGRADVEQVETAARELGMRVRTCTHQDVTEVLRQGRFGVIGLEFGDDSQRGLALLRDLAERLPQAAIFVASADTNVATMRTALEAGATDYLTLPLNPIDLSRVLIRTSQESVSKAASRATSGEVVTLYGCRGGLGCTTLAVNLAVHLRNTSQGEVALVDLDLQRSDVAAFLNLTPSQSIAALADAREIDEIFLHSAMSRHSSGLFILAAPEKVEEAENVGHAEVTSAFRLLRSQYRFTVADTPRTITPAVVAAFEQSDHLLLVTDLTVPGVRATRRAMDLLQKLEIPMQTVQLIVTQATPGAIDLADAARTIGKDPYLVVPNDENAANQAMNTGAPLNGKQSALSEAIAELAGKITGGEAAPARRRGGLFRRIFTREARA